MENSGNEGVRELPKAVAFEAVHADEWGWRIEDCGHFQVWGRRFLEKIILVLIYGLGHVFLTYFWG